MLHVNPVFEIEEYFTKCIGEVISGVTKAYVRTHSRAIVAGRKKKKLGSMIRSLFITSHKHGQKKI